MHCLSRSAERMRITTSGEEETRQLGALLGRLAFPGLTILLHGGLGMGKTVLTQGIGSSLGHRGIKSPTFILVSEHDGDLPMVHADLYRLDSYMEADALDFENYIDSGCLLVVEWAERWHTPPLKDTLDITITNGEDDENSRTITVRALGERAIEMLGRLSDEVSKNIR
jgi:tRNA threonylcarbamoyladenosine biosynthesis protein TsaE